MSAVTNTGGLRPKTCAVVITTSESAITAFLRLTLQLNLFGVSSLA